MRTITLLFKITCIVLIVPLALSLITLYADLDLSNARHQAYMGAVVLAFLLSLLFIKSHGYFAVLLHELTHNLLAVLTFNKPIALNVSTERGGHFQFQGHQNILSLLSPYFFPTLSFFWLLIYFLISKQSEIIYFGILGASYGISQSIAIRQLHWQQADLKPFGLFWSYLFILFFQLLIHGILTSFALSSIEGNKQFLLSIFTHLIELANQFKLLLPHVKF